MGAGRIEGNRDEPRSCQIGWPRESEGSEGLAFLFFKMKNFIEFASVCNFLSVFESYLIGTSGRELPSSPTIHTYHGRLQCLVNCIS